MTEAWTRGNLTGAHNDHRETHGVCSCGLRSSYLMSSGFPSGPSEAWTAGHVGSNQVRAYFRATAYEVGSHISPH